MWRDTRLAWDENIRLTYITDALGYETRCYNDILDHTYRIKYASSRGASTHRERPAT